jgi:hypothetical protein
LDESFHSEASKRHVANAKLVISRLSSAASGGGLFLELDAESGQARPMAAYLRELGFDAIRPHRDLSGAERFLEATLSDGL